MGQENDGSYVFWVELEVKNEAQALRRANLLIRAIEKFFDPKADKAEKKVERKNERHH